MARCIAEREDDDHHVVQWPDHRKELRDQVDRRDHPERGDRDHDLDSRWYSWILAESTCGGHARRKGNRDVARKAVREATSEEDEDEPERDDRDERADEPLPPHVKHARL